MLKVLPRGMSIAPPPPQSQLDFKSDAAKELKGKVVMYNWSGIGWWAGSSKRPSADKTLVQSKLVKVDR